MFSSAQVSDTGRFTCVAVNAGGETLRDYDLHVYGEYSLNHTHTFSTYTLTHTPHSRMSTNKSVNSAQAIRYNGEMSVVC